jgi:hypothetical protein
LEIQNGNENTAIKHLITYLDILISEQAHILEVLVKWRVVPSVSLACHCPIVHHTPKELLNWHSCLINVMIAWGNLDLLSIMGRIWGVIHQYWSAILTIGQIRLMLSSMRLGLMFQIFPRLG